MKRSYLATLAVKTVASNKITVAVSNEHLMKVKVPAMLQLRVAI